MAGRRPANARSSDGAFEGNDTSIPHKPHHPPHKEQNTHVVLTLTFSLHLTFLHISTSRGPCLSHGPLLSPLGPAASNLLHPCVPPAPSLSHPISPESHGGDRLGAAHAQQRVGPGHVRRRHRRRRRSRRRDHNLGRPGRLVCSHRLVPSTNRAIETIGSRAKRYEMDRPQPRKCARGESKASGGGEGT